MSIITVNELSLAIERILNVNSTIAKKYANMVMDFFGFEDRIIDNTLEQKERQLFYMLEAEGILHTEREKITLQDGRQWRIHYWILQKNTIHRYLNNKYANGKKKIDQQSQMENIYTYLSSEQWSSRKNTAI